MVEALDGWIRSWGKLPEPESFSAYLDLIAERSAYRRVYEEA